MALIGNKVLEKDLRDHLSTVGYFGRSANFSNVRLVAVQRPGWVQVFSFDVRANHETEGWLELHGACIDDEREKRFEVVLDKDVAVRDKAIIGWSDGLITLNREPMHIVTKILLGAFVLALTLIAFAALTRS